MKKLHKILIDARKAGHQPGARFGPFDHDPDLKIECTFCSRVIAVEEAWKNDGWRATQHTEVKCDKR